MERKTIGVVGGGQLCLMMGEAIEKNSLPFRLIALDPTENCPAYPFLDEQLVGDFKEERLIRELADTSDIVTYEIELAGSNILQELETGGKIIHPSPQTLRIIQDKYTQFNFLRKNGIPVPYSREIKNSRDGLIEALNFFGMPVMIKARRDSYDGRGNFLLEEESQIEEALSQFNDRDLMAQRYVNFVKEISVIAVRSTTGKIQTYPVGENEHGKDYNILLTTIIPARINSSIEQKARNIAANTLNVLEGAGVFGIEMFVTENDVLINEIAPRVHNSGHYTIEACKTSQFENHLRAISGMDLGDTSLLRSTVMHNIIGEVGYEGPCQIIYDGKVIEGTKEINSGIYIHNYGKSARPWRKLGHLTIVGKDGENLDELQYRSSSIKNLIKIKAA